MSEGYCEVDFGDASSDADPVEFSHTTTIKHARKATKCDECREPIAVGESYRKVVYKFEGQLEVERSCEPCNEARAEFAHNIYGGCLWVYFREEWSNGANVQGCINRLTTARAKQHMRRQWAKWKGI